jgi:hypothetical protein
MILVDRRKTIDGRIQMRRPEIRRNSISIDDQQHDIISPNQIKSEKSEVGLIKIRTPGQLNESVRTSIMRNSLQQPLSSHQQQQQSSMRAMNGQNNNFVLKRLGNTTIRSVPQIPQNKSLISETYQSNLVTRSSGPPLRRMSAMPSENRQVKPNIVIDIRDHIIKELQEQNREMKKTLYNFKKEATQMNMRLKVWTDSIDTMLVKFSRLSNPLHEKQISPKQNIPKQPSPPMNQPSLNPRRCAIKSTSISTVKQPPTVVIFKEPSPRIESPASNISNIQPSPKTPSNTSQSSFSILRNSISNIKTPESISVKLSQPSPPVRIVARPSLPVALSPARQIIKPNVPNEQVKRKYESDDDEGENEVFESYVAPDLPMTQLDDLVEIEDLLHKQLYFSHMKGLIYSKFRDISIEKPSLMLDIVLKHILHVDLIKHLKHNGEKSHDNLQEDIRDFPLVIDLFSSLVNMLSLSKFKKRVDPKSIQEFIKRKFTKKEKKIEENSESAANTEKETTKEVKKVVSSPLIPEKPKNPIIAVGNGGRKVSFDPSKLILNIKKTQPVNNKDEKEDKEDSDEELFTLE